MRGSATEPGVIPMAVQDLFNFIEEEMDREFLLRMSYMEIYNEEINDLLAPEHRKLQIHESIERGIFVAGLREEIVASPDQVLELMDFGESHRHIGETNMNLHSSRSHTIYRMIIESREKVEDTEADNSCDAVRVSVLNLVDLAGSERAAKTGAEGVRLKEGSHINKSLMTLGTVIKKLSEGAESQGGHVPYRDSKLTRILQPALGGNANTAIICNITLAQIHADETKSSLQFASRALRVTNCVHVNEILTDAALLKRQKKEIEELRAKLQASHSEHLDEEILNLRNTLLKSELERERIALELEEEKKAQAEREKRLQEQAKKIENLSSMVLCSNRDEGRDTYKKEKRRYTWCPGNLSREALKELSSAVKEKGSVVKAKRIEREIGPLLPFEELLDADSNLDSGKQEDNSRSNQLEECTLPDLQALLHVTSRRKGASRKKSSSMWEDNDLLEFQREYEELLLKYESHKTVSEIKIDYLARKLFEADIHLIDGSEQDDHSLMHLYGSKTLREAGAILVMKQLQEKITVLEMERSSSQQNLDSVVEMATEQTISAREKHEGEEYRKLEVLAFEMETTIASLEEELTISHAENEEANSRAENLACELQALSDELNMSNTELSMLKEEFSCLRLCAEESESRCQRLETSVNSLVEEKEDLAMQLTDALLKMEEEKAIWFAREKATVEAINEKEKSYSTEIANVSQKMTEVTNQLESCRIQCKLLEERLVDSENNVLLDKSFSEEKLLEIDQLRLGLRVAEEQCKRSQEMLTLEHQDLRKEVERLQMELSMLSKERVDLSARIRESKAEPIQRDDFQLSNSNHEVEQLSEKLSALEVKMHNGEVNHRNDKAKLRMRLRGAQAKLDAFRVRYKEALDEMHFMNKKFEVASSKLKDQLASSGLEILSLKKLLASARGP